MSLGLVLTRQNPYLGDIPHELYKTAIFLAEKHKAMGPALELFQSAAEQGHTVALLNLVSYYRSVEPKKALELLWKGADEASGEVLYRLALTYFKGDLAGKDPQLAVDCLLRSARKKYPDALVLLGRCYERGDVVPQSDLMAFQTYSEGYFRGAPGSHHALGKCYLFGKGVPQDTAKALELFRSGALVGCLQSLFQLAICHEQGIGAERPNYELAVRYYRKLCRCGHVLSIHNLALAFLNGRGVEMSWETAFRLFKLNADHGHVPSMNMLAEVLLARSKDSLDEKEALQWLLKASKLGDPAAISLMQRRFPHYSLRRVE